jgi:hypothetical protein
MLSMLSMPFAALFAMSLLCSGVNHLEEEIDVTGAISRAVSELIDRQEGVGEAEWPYEGVYRVAPYHKLNDERKQIPYGYRVGGTSITAMALMSAPDYANDEVRQLAVRKATEFVFDATDAELMNPDYPGGYDVRGWGYIYALDFLLRLKREGQVPEGMDSKVKRATTFYLSALEEIEIPEHGGWNYARPKEIAAPSSTSPFMTGPALQALFAAKHQGFRVDKKVVKRALDALERSRTESGEVVYSVGGKQAPVAGMLPGSVGRMLVTETTLFIAGRGSLSKVRGSIDAFLVHWDWLDVRRAQDRTHIPPYMVAPYYFYYAHFQAAQAIELLPEVERPQYRKLLRERLFSVRLEDGIWNDRVFARTANYGTAIALSVMTMPEQAPLPGGEE